MPCSVRTPSPHFDRRELSPSRPNRSRSRRAASSPCRPRSRWRRSGSRARIPCRRPRGPSCVISLHAPALVSTSVTLGRLKASQVVVVEARALAELPVVGLECLGSRGVLHCGVHPSADLLHLLEVGHLGSVGISALRREILGFPSLIPVTRSFRSGPVQPSFTRSSSCGSRPRPGC